MKYLVYFIEPIKFAFLLVCIRITCLCLISETNANLHFAHLLHNMRLERCRGPYQKIA